MAQQLGSPGGSEERPAVFFRDAAEFRAWLEANHASAAELWMGLRGKHVEPRGITWEEAVPESGERVKFALASGGTREFLPNVRKAVAAGLPANVALEALTIRPAEMVGAGDILGSVEAGKIANLVVTNGDILSDSARVSTRAP